MPNEAILIGRVLVEITDEALEAGHSQEWTRVFDRLEEVRGEAYEQRQRLVGEMRGELHSVWGAALQETALLVDMLQAIVELRSNQLQRPGALNDPPAWTILAVAARASRAARETEQLLWSGFGYGARARWRTFYELTVVLHLLRHPTRGPLLVEDYHDHQRLQQVRELARLVDHLHQCAPKHSAISGDELQRIETSLARLRADAATDGLNAKHSEGSAFAKHAWGWNRSLFDGRPKGFMSMLDCVPAGMSCLRHFYWVASGEVHGTTPGTLLNIEPLPDGWRRQPTDATFTGLAEAGLTLTATIPWCLRAVLRAQMAGVMVPGAAQLMPAVTRLADDARNAWAEAQRSPALAALLPRL